MTPLEKRLMLDASLPTIAGQVLWLDAADATTVRDADGDNAATGTGGANNGFAGTVTTWTDKSASGFNVTQATAGNRPTYTTNALNGNSVLTFDGTTDRLVNTGAVITGNDYTMFIVFNRTTAAARDAVFEIGGGGSRNALFVNDSGNRLGLYANSTFYNSSAVYTANTYEVVTMMHDVNAINMWRDGSNQLNTTGLTRAATTGIYVGDDSSGGDNLQGNIAEIIVYDRDLTADERRDVENYLAGKWGRTIASNVAPVLGTNTGATVSQGDPVTITTAMLSSTDADNSESILRYTITDLGDHGTLTNTNTAHTYILGEIFSQADIDAGYIVYTHDNSANFTDSFSFTVTDLYATTAGATFNLTITPDNVAPVIGGWTLVSSEDFQGGATGWSINTTETINPYLTRFLGRSSNEGGLQLTHKTYALSGTQDYTIIEFDFYRLDTWDTEQFRIFIDDTLIYNQTFTTAYSTPPNGASGNVSWTIQELTPFATNLGGGGSTDQIFRFTLRVDTTAATVKLGFSSTTNQAIGDESWGVDNVDIYEVGAGGVPGPVGIVENSAIGTVIGQVSANDADVADTITYSIVGGTGAGVFTINASTGVITTTAALNYEVINSYTLDIRATDNGAGNLFDAETITINILDMPENNAPTIAALGPFSIAENTANGTVIGTAVGNDVNGNTITYSITAGNTDNIFAINATTGAIRVNANTNMNFEWDNSYTLTITATDNGFGNLTGTQAVVVNITNINEAPTFNIPQSFLNENPYLRYNAATGNFYRYISGTTNFAAANTAAAAALLNGVAGHVATIGDAAENTYVRSLGSGALWLSGSDATTEGNWIWGGNGAEAGQVFSIGAAVQAGFYTNWQGGQPDNASNSDFLEMAASGLWADVNGGNRAYVIEWEGSAVLAALGNGPFTLAENPAMSQSVGFVHARDADAGDTIAYSITGGTGSAYFAVNSSTGEITVTDPSAINYELATSYTLDMRVQDLAGLFHTQTVTINLTDVNETPVIPAAGPFTVSEDAAVNTVVGTVTATDVDAGQTLTYSITGGNPNGLFAINAATGAIRIANTTYLDYELANTYTLTIRATDNGTGSLNASRNVVVNVTNVNEGPSFDAVQRVLNSDPTLHYSAATGSFYRYVTTATNLATAQANAAAALVNGVAGHVTNITSLAENNFVRALTNASSWIGGTDISVEGEWRWSGGPEAGQLFWLGNGAGSAQNGFYENWNGAEPNNSGGNEDAIELQTGGGWNDTNAAGSRPYVIEWTASDVIASLLNGPYDVPEHSPLTFSPGSALANDPDGGDTLTYSITGGTGSGIFAINTSTGAITLTSGVNYELVNSYTLDLRVEDAAGLFDTLSITVSISDENDIPTALLSSGSFIEENSAVGTLLGSLTTTDEDPADLHTYTIVSDPFGKFTLVGNELRTAAAIDYEQNQTFTIILRTADGNGGTFDRTILINVGDVMDTFTPPPSTGGGGNSETYIPPEEEVNDATYDILSASLSGEQGQAYAFYGSEGLQILRENLTFRIREILNHIEENEEAGFITNIIGMMDFTLAAIDDVNEPERAFTNLRMALEFLQQMADGEKGNIPTDSADKAHEERMAALPDNSIDRQFVDVMTYHQDRAARLREALMGTA